MKVEPGKSCQVLEIGHAHKLQSSAAPSSRKRGWRRCTA